MIEMWISVINFPRKWIFLLCIWGWLSGPISAHASLATTQDFPILKGPYLGQDPPGDTPELFAPGIISTCTQHSSVYFSAEGRALVFSRMFPRPSVILYMQEVDGTWTLPQVIAEGLTPFLTSDGDRIYFSTWSLWVVDRTSRGWGVPRELGPAVNFQKRQDGPSVTRNGTLYYCSMFGDRDGIYRVRFQNGRYSQRMKIGGGVNSPHVDGMPYISPDESYLIFASFRPGSQGLGDLYISFRKAGGEWSSPVNLGPKINTSAKEGFPFVTYDGKYLFFMSNRVSELNEGRIPDGPGNVYWVDAALIPRLRRRVLGK